MVSTFASGFSGNRGVWRSTEVETCMWRISEIDTVSKVTPAGVVSLFASGLGYATGLAFDGNGNLYVANWGATNTVSEVTPAGVVSTFASGFSEPWALAFDGGGNLYVATESDGSVFMVTPTGAVSIFARGSMDLIAIAIVSASVAPTITVQPQNATGRRTECHGLLFSWSQRRARCEHFPVAGFDRRRRDMDITVQ